MSAPINCTASTTRGKRARDDETVLKIVQGCKKKYVEEKRYETLISRRSPSQEFASKKRDIERHDNLPKTLSNDKHILRTKNIANRASVT